VVVRRNILRKNVGVGVGGGGGLLYTQQRHCVQFTWQTSYAIVSILENVFALWDAISFCHGRRQQCNVLNHRRRRLQSINQQWDVWAQWCCWELRQDGTSFSPWWLSLLHCALRFSISSADPQIRTCESALN